MKKDKRTRIKLHKKLEEIASLVAKKKGVSYNAAINLLVYKGYQGIKKKKVPRGYGSIRRKKIKK